METRDETRKENEKKNKMRQDVILNRQEMRQKGHETRLEEKVIDEKRLDENMA